jgi:hypothetical protein
LGEEVIITVVPCSLLQCRQGRTRGLGIVLSELNYAQSEDRSQATKLPTQAEDRDLDVSSQGLKNTQFPRFGAEINLHIIRGSFIRNAKHAKGT